MSAEQTTPLPADFDVRAWLGRMNLPQYADAFAENEINAVALPMLNEEDLKAIGVRILGHRKIILHDIQKLTAAAPIAVPPAPAPTERSAPASTAAPAPAPVISPSSSRVAGEAPKKMPDFTVPAPPPVFQIQRSEIVFKENEEEITRSFLDPGEYVIGSDSGCDLVLNDQSISPRHARLTVSSAQWLIEDLGSNLGTKLNGVAVKERTHVLPNQKIEIGAVVAVLGRVLAPSTAPSPPEKPAWASTLSAPRVPDNPLDATPSTRRGRRSRSAPARQRLGLWARIAASKFLIVSIALHVFFGVGAAVYVVQRYQAKRKLAFQGGPPLVSASKRVLEHRVSMAKKKNTMSAPAQARRITTTGLSKVALPDMPALPNSFDVVPKRMAGMGGMGVGPGFGIGGGMGTGMGTGTGTFTLPRIVADRCSAASRAAAMKAAGGDPRCEDAILKGLTFLKSQQNADGSFGSSYKVAMTGLSLLSFLGHCEKPNSQEYGPCVRKAIDYLVKLGVANNGKLATNDGNGWAYEHGMATYALGEAYIFTREEAIAPVLRSAIKIIVDGQGGDGGWVYGMTKVGDGDTSVTGWQIQALKAAHLTDLKIEGVEACMKKAMEDFLRVQGPKGGFGYRTKGDKWSLTGVGVFCLQIGTGQKGRPVVGGLKYIQDAAPAIKYKGPEANLYAWYYNTQACFQAGGYDWGKWNREFQPELLAHQGSDGSWEETGSTTDGAVQGAFHYTGTGTTVDAQVYRTSLCILMLEVFYRYLATNRS